jgi:hypothetical protein
MVKVDAFAGAWRAVMRSVTGILFSSGSFEAAGVNQLFEIVEDLLIEAV